MDDPDDKIRAGLDEGDWSTRGLSNALRAVLDDMNRRDEEDDSDPSPEDIRRIIARELGVKP